MLFDEMLLWNNVLRCPSSSQQQEEVFTPNRMLTRKLWALTVSYRIVAGSVIELLLIQSGLASENHIKTLPSRLPGSPEPRRHVTGSEFQQDKHRLLKMEESSLLIDVQKIGP
ncbi:unnamed protein product [Urochloa humidicola]